MEVEATNILKIFLLLESSKNIGEFEHWSKHSPIHNQNIATRSTKLDQIINYKESYLELNIIILFIYSIILMVHSLKLKKSPDFQG